MAATDAFTVNIGDFERSVPLVAISPGVAIAYLDFLCDRELIHAAGRELARLLAPLRPGCLVAPATGAIPLCYETSCALDVPYVILRKGVRGYMERTLSAPVRSAAAPTDETLLVEERYLALMKYSRVVLLDTVTTSGSTFDAMAALMRAVAVEPIARAVAFVEGESVDARAYVHIGTLPRIELEGRRDHGLEEE